MHTTAVAKLPTYTKTTENKIFSSTLEKPLIVIIKNYIFRMNIPGK